MAKGKQHGMTPIRESEDGTSSSGDNVATEGEEEDDEEQRFAMRHSTRNRREDEDEDEEEEEEEHAPLSSKEDVAGGSEELTPYVAKCYGHLETLRKRKREQEERVETLVEETFGQIETIMQEIMRGLQERHAVSHAHFEATESKLSRSLREHNRTEKKLKLIASILLREDTDE
ncbi:unnamed protein product [Hyaloperonospora brassicae]|uniref:Uncharacterized protein n=1 Tax=Hyaloperonospora brassicae TaxID=162125 RepID=A0AAV0U7F5_HYABA|nr:unnamed protein product [Hyaloperonospora brassicae]